MSSLIFYKHFKLSHGARMNDPVSACRSAGESQMSWCWLDDVVRRMLERNKSKTIQDNAKNVKALIDAKKAERYVVSVNNAGEAKIIGIN